MKTSKDLDFILRKKPKSKTEVCGTREHESTLVNFYCQIQICGREWLTYRIMRAERKITDMFWETLILPFENQ